MIDLGLDMLGLWKSSGKGSGLSGRDISQSRLRI
jgi:hypothetical protein